MATHRSIASLSLTFGLVSIPVKLYSATESSTAIRFRLMAPGGARVRQQYVADALPFEAAGPTEAPEAPAREASTTTRRKGAEPALPAAFAGERVVAFPTRASPPVVEAPTVAPPTGPDEPVMRSEMVKGYEFEKGQFVLFTAEELKALESESRQTIDIVSFIPANAVDPIYYDKPYFLAPDKRGAKPYSLLLKAMQDTGRAALAKWAWRSKEYVVQVRPGEGGLVLQQLLYADEVRSLADLGIELAAVGDAELGLARRLIEQIAADGYDPSAFVDEEKQRILAAVERKIAGQQIVTHGQPTRAAPATGGEVVDLVAALRASLAPGAPKAKRSAGTKAAKTDALEANPRKAARRASGGTPTQRTTAKR